MGAMPAGIDCLHFGDQAENAGQLRLGRLRFPSLDLIASPAPGGRLLSDIALSLKLQVTDT